MVDLWDVLFMVLMLILALLLPKISPCCGCIVADGPEGTEDCRKECRAFDAYAKKVNRQQ